MHTFANILHVCIHENFFIILKFQYNFQGWGAWPYAGLSLPKVSGKFNANSNGASQKMCTCRPAYICKHFACLHTQKWTHNLITQITLKVHSEYT